MPANSARLDPKRVAEELFSEHKDERAWLDSFAEHLDRRRGGHALARVQDVWGLSQADSARLFGVSRQAVGKWLSQGMPAERAAAIANLAAATDLLVHYLKRDRIAAVVRRPIAALGGVSLLDLLANNDTARVLTACRDMFAFGDVQR